VAAARGTDREFYAGLAGVALFTAALAHYWLYAPDVPEPQPEPVKAHASE
jgi:hypothetical protein